MFAINKTALALIAVSIFLIGSCKKDDPEIPNEEELITTLIYTLTPESGGTPIEFSFRDLDGDGGNAPIITEGTLDANTTYNGSLVLLNETESPAGDITEEIEEEDEDHQFFFNVSSSLELDISYDDQDGNGNPIGLATIAVSGNASQGQLTIVLRHEPNKTAAGVSDGDITNAGGETDIEVTFDVIIQ